MTKNIYFPSLHYSILDVLILAPKNRVSASWSAGLAITHCGQRLTSRVPLAEFFIPSPLPGVLWELCMIRRSQDPESSLLELGACISLAALSSSEASNTPALTQDLQCWGLFAAALHAACLNFAETAKISRPWRNHRSASTFQLAK